MAAPVVGTALLTLSVVVGGRLVTADVMLPRRDESGSELADSVELGAGEPVLVADSGVGAGVDVGAAPVPVPTLVPEDGNTPVGAADEAVPTLVPVPEEGETPVGAAEEARDSDAVVGEITLERSEAAPDKTELITVPTDGRIPAAVVLVPVLEVSVREAAALVAVVAVVVAVVPPVPLYATPPDVLVPSEVVVAAALSVLEVELEEVKTPPGPKVIAPPEVEEGGSGVLVVPVVLVVPAALVLEVVGKIIDDGTASVDPTEEEVLLVVATAELSLVEEAAGASVELVADPVPT